MKRAAIYARISDDTQGEGLGVSRQIKDCQDLVLQRGWLLDIEPYVDNDVSATRSKSRPAYERLLADIEAGKVDAVVVWALDRLHRRPIELEHFIALVERKGVSLDNVTGSVDISTDDGQMYARVMGAVAALEAKNIGKRVRRKQAQLREAGMPFSGGKRCYGWDADRLTPIPAEQAEIGHMVGWVLSGRSANSLVRDLNARQVPTVSQWMAEHPTKRRAIEGNPIQGRPWSLTSVRTLLSKPRLAGLLTYKGEVVGKGAWEPVIDRSTFDRLQMALLQRSPVTWKANNARRYLLSGIARCGVCGVGLQVGSSPDKNPAHRRYRCPSVAAGKSAGSGIPHGGRNMAALDRHVVDCLLVALDAHRSSPDEGEEQVDPGPEIDMLRDRLNVAADQFADGVLTGEQMQRITTRVRAQIAALEASRPVVGSETRLDWHLGTREPQAAREAFWALPLEHQRGILLTTLGEFGSIVVLPAAVLNKGLDTSTIHVTWVWGTTTDLEVSAAAAYEQLARRRDLIPQSGLKGL